MRPFLFDTTVFVYAAGRPHAYREPCSADRDFDGVPGLERIDPADKPAVEALLD